MTNLQHRVINYLARFPSGKFSVAQLSESLGVQKPSILRALKALHEAGKVSRREPLPLHSGRTAYLWSAAQ